MKKLGAFFYGIILVTVLMAALVVTTAIYETSKKTTIETYFFQPNDLAYQRQSNPRALQDMSDEELQNMLLNKYIAEYFYVTPDVEEVAKRMNSRTSTLARMSTGKVYDSWLKDVAPGIEEMARQNMLRTASVVSIEPQAGSNKYWRVEYELKTWTRPNDLAASPEVTRGVMFMEFVFRHGLREAYKKQGVAAQELEAGKDPAPLFSFGVIDITTQEE